jgi:hypothetical protein
MYSLLSFNFVHYLVQYSRECPASLLALHCSAKLALYHTCLMSATTFLEFVPALLAGRLDRSLVDTLDLELCLEFVCFDLDLQFSAGWVRYPIVS